ncbi:MAG: helix-turn-helix transcriptional regulator [Chloroflexota bacterium]
MQANFLQPTFDQTAEQKTEEIYHRFGSSVRTIRRTYNLTQADLAERAGMNKTYLVRIEAGDNNVTLKTAQRIACALDVDLLTLLKGVHVTLKGM